MRKEQTKNIHRPKKRMMRSNLESMNESGSSQKQEDTKPLHPGKNRTYTMSNPIQHTTKALCSNITSAPTKRGVHHCKMRTQMLVNELAQN